MNQKECGATAVDLLIAVAMAMCLSAVSLPKATSTLSEYRLRNDVRRLVATCHNARFLAVSTNFSHRLHWDGSVLQVQRISGGSYTTVDQAPLSPGISVASAWVSDPVFSPRGHVTNPGNAVIANNQGRQRTVSVSLLGLIREQ